MSRAPWLTRSQVDRIARLLADGATSREIVRLMGVSQGTVSNVRMGKVAGKRPAASGQRPSERYGPSSGVTPMPIVTALCLPLRRPSM